MRSFLVETRISGRVYPIRSRYLALHSDRVLLQEAAAL